MLADGLRRWYDVAREVHYPSTAGRKLTHRPRCDLVLTPKGRALKLDSSPPTLFDPPDLCDPSDALWLEVKVAYQFREGGVRHGGYGAQWQTNVVEDLRKMEADEKIREAGLVLLVFNESGEILEKDLELFEDVLARKEVTRGLPALFAASRSWTEWATACARRRCGRPFSARSNAFGGRRACRPGRWPYPSALPPSTSLGQWASSR
jgi:hypothetical protein